MVDEESRLISATDTANVIRRVLKNTYPATRFSVRTQYHAGGASIYVSWTGEPAESDVRRFVANYQGSDFDAMIDLRYSIEHWLLPDGSTKVRHNHGSVGSGGEIAEVDNRHLGHSMPPGTEPVHFGVDYIRVWRKTDD